VIFGILLAYLSNYVVGRVFPGNDEWRIKLGVAAVPAVLFFLALFTIPRSPRWLVKKGRIAEARDVLRMTGEAGYEAQLQGIRLSIDAEHGHAGETLFSRKYRVPILLAVSIAIFNQLSGINAILYYMNDIFSRAGFGKTSGDLQAVVVGATNMIFTILAMSIIDKVGRKILLLIGSIGMGVSLTGVGLVFWTARYENLLVWLLAAFIAFFGFSQGAVIWVFISEIFPTRVRAGGQSLGSLTHWLMNAMISWMFPVVAAASHSAPFFFFSVAMFVQFFVVLFFFPETKGLSLEELQTKLSIT
jgi:sugar porter (SP) family MFS transporter